jgi:hypothetical protein
MGKISVSFDGGGTWTVAKPQPSETNQSGAWDENYFYSYWVPAPQGATSVTFRGRDTAWGAPWWVVDPAVWSTATPASPPTTAPPTPTPAPTQAPVALLPSQAPATPRPAPHLVEHPAGARLPLGLSGFAAVVGGLLVLVVVAGGGAGVAWARRRRRPQPPLP